MTIDWQLVQAFLLLAGIFFIIGTPIKLKFSNVPFFFLPVVGFIAFGGLIVPAMYLAGGWHPWILYSSFALLITLGLISFGILGFRAIRKRTISVVSTFAVVLIALFMSGLIIQASKYSVPGGIDPAFHAAFINNIVQSNTFNTSYPLGMHVLALFMVDTTSFSLPTVLLALSLFIIFSIFVLVYFVAKTLTKSSIGGLFGACLAVVDVSIYNNYLNGSITHLLAILLVLSGIALVLCMPLANRGLIFIALIVLYTATFYFHFITLFALVPAIWFLRIHRENGPHWTFPAAFLVSLIVAIPVLSKFFIVAEFQKQFFLINFSAISRGGFSIKRLT